MTKPNRDEYKTTKGIARWWSKDGLWHIALPNSENGNYRWTLDEFNTREEAIAEIERAIEEPS